MSHDGEPLQRAQPEIVPVRATVPPYIACWYREFAIESPRLHPTDERCVVRRVIINPQKHHGHEVDWNAETATVAGHVSIQRCVNTKSRHRKRGRSPAQVHEVGFAFGAISSHHVVEVDSHAVYET